MGELKRPWCPSDWDDVRAHLKAPHDLVKRYRSMFMVKQMAPTLPEAIETFCNMLKPELRESPDNLLLRHEMCYLLGQIADATAVPTLLRILHDSSEAEIVRHEAAEALAAVGDAAAVSHLEKYLDADDLPGLRDTCELAVVGLKEDDDSRVCACHYPHPTKDPAKGDVNATLDDVPQLSETLLDESVDLYTRYKAMFTLRNLESTTALERVLLEDQSSTVFRHEIAYVLGQVASESSTEALVKSLSREDESDMVRHEAAIALGTVGTDLCRDELKKFVNDKNPIVADSCIVALATIEYWNFWEEKERQLGADNSITDN